MRRRTVLRVLCSLLAVGGLIELSPAVAIAAGADPKTYTATVDKALAYFKTAQAADGSWSAQGGPAITAVVTTAILRTGRTPDDPLVSKSLKYLEGFVQKDGAICAPDSKYKNYETCVCTVCFAEANKDGRYKKILEGADKYVKGEQWGEPRSSVDEADLRFGGAGYGDGNKRPDLSNTSFLVDALKATGNGPDDEAMKRALVFVSRCQNLESSHNTSPFPAKNPDGGFYYTVAAGGGSPAGTLPNGGLRSYASMTYAGLKSMVFAGVNKDDPRVKAAVKWVQNHYDLESNPGMGDAGLYYYYHTFAKALDAIGYDKVADEKGTEHDWRNELCEVLAKHQATDGSWLNVNTRWLEGDKNLASGFALLALTYCKPGDSKK